MGYTPPDTVTGSSVLTAALWNQQVRDNEEWLRKRPMCQVHRLTTWTASGTAISWTTTAAFDTDSMFSSATPTRITFKTAGIYSISSYIVAVGAANWSLAQTQYWLNGSLFFVSNHTESTAAASYSVEAQTVIDAAANDYIEANVALTGTTLASVTGNTLTSPLRSRLTVTMLGQKS